MPKYEIHIPSGITWTERTEQTVSASKKKKIRQEVSAQAQTTRTEKDKEEKRSALLYRVVGIVCTIAVVFLAIWNTGLIQRSSTAVTVKGVKYSVADMQYFFNTNKQSTLSFYYQNLGMMPFSTAASTKSQIFDSETGATWYDYLMEQSMKNVVLYTAVQDAAKEEGFTLSEDSKTYLAEQLKQLETTAKDRGYKNTTAYLRANYGPYMTLEHFQELYEANLLVGDYIDTVTGAFNFSDAEYQAYYKEHANEMDTFVLSQLVVRAALDEDKAKDMTEEEKTAAMETAKADAKKLADEIYAKLQAGADPSALVKEYGDKLYGSNISAAQLGVSLNSTYADWARDAARKNGDLTVTDYAGSATAHYYYVVRFENRYLDQSSTADVRHILIASEVSEGAKEATDAQKAEAKAKAEKLLAEFKAGKADEESFSFLAVQNSADEGSAATGGLISGISADSNYVPAFKEWALDSARTAGDAGLVESSYGWHIMYYVGDGDPVWKQSTRSGLSSDAYAAWEKEICEGYEASSGIGLKFIQS